MYRLIAFVAPILGALWLWDRLGRPAAAAGAVALAVLGVVAWPLALILLIAVVPYSISLLWPRSARAKWRNRRSWWTGQKIARQSQSSQDIPGWMRRILLIADRYRCLNCGHEPADLRELHSDHRVPWSWGGLTLLPNLFLLCATCNVVKMTYWVDRHGVEHGRTSNLDVARDVWAAERRARYSLLRWLRIAWAFA